MDVQTTTKGKNKRDTTRKKNHRAITKLVNRCSTSKEIDIALYLLEFGPASRLEVVKGTGIKWTTTHDTLSRLLIKGIVKRTVIKESRGRPTVYWSLAKNAV